MRLAALITATCAWLRALAGPLTLLGAGAIAFAACASAGIDRLWPLALLAALGVGLAIGWAGLIATSKGRNPNRPRGDGEAEGL